MGLEMAMIDSAFPLPPSILAMLLIFVVLVITGWIWKGLDQFYARYIRAPVRLPIPYQSLRRLPSLYRRLMAFAGRSSQPTHVYWVFRTDRPSLSEPDSIWERHRTHHCLLL
jgi:hypothetical protein